ncbi:hypothetical protein T265_09606 [Opisthorchis viverrini]|uniref:SOUL heme-binding protein n=1 Tax=Opisthorchis viverrini TaxID=6198 RepID=A0A074ZG96_OPIVI|nr:hypothetical protein T265_09606 [Opisthorchis viverrini]KER22280.1 hypothetical protein T265_09606 [Opisthorchis viverrini]
MLRDLCQILGICVITIAFNSTSVSNIDASLAYNCDLFESFIMIKRANGMRYQDGWVGAENLMMRYFDGDNSENRKLPFGCPIVTKIDPSEGPACESQLTFAAALPNKWTQVPQPRTDELTLSQWPKLHVYARPFLGPNNQETFRQESLNFADSLRTIGLRYQTEPYFWVIPDPPNEPAGNLQVWFLVEEP